MERLCLLLLVGLQHLLSRRLPDWDPIPRAPTIAQVVQAHEQEGEDEGEAEEEVSPHVEEGKGEGEGEGELEAHDRVLECASERANGDAWVQEAGSPVAVAAPAAVPAFAEATDEVEAGRIVADGGAQPSEDVPEAVIESAKPVQDAASATVAAGEAEAAAATDDSSEAVTPSVPPLTVSLTPPRTPARAISSPRKKKPDLKLLTKSGGGKSRKMAAESVPDGLPSPLTATNKRRSSLEVVTREQWSALGAPKPAPEGGGLKVMLGRSHSEGEEEPARSEAQRTAAAAAAAGAAVGPGSGRSVSFSSSAGAAAAVAALTGVVPLALSVDVAKTAALGNMSISLRGLAEVPENEELPETPAGERGERKKRDLSFLKDERSPKMKDMIAEKKLTASERAELLAAMTKSQGFGPKAKGPVGDMFAAALHEAVTGRSRSQAFSATGKQENEHFFSRTLSRTRLHALVEDDEPKEQRWMSMAPSKVDVDLIGDIAPGVKMEKFSY